VIEDFMSRIRDDPRISRVHISIYVSLWKIWVEAGRPKQISFFRNDIKDMCKISSLTTYYKSLSELDEYGYIKYTASVNHNKGSRVEFASMDRNN
jgi:hypothetical protein